MKDSPNHDKRSHLPNILKKIRIIYTIAFQNGFSRLIQVEYIYLLEPTFMNLIPFYARLVLLWKRRIWKKMDIKRDLACWRQKKSDFIQKGKNLVLLEELGINEDGLKLVQEKIKENKEVLIANIDQDGFFLSHYGPIDGVPCINKKKFLSRSKYLVDLIIIDGFVGIKKNYQRNAISFLNELKILYTLSKAGCNVPSILDADFENNSLTVSYIPGSVLREQLAVKGSILRDKDVNKNPEFTQLSPKAIRIKRIEEGKKFIHSVVDGSFIEKLYDQISKIHLANVFINDIKYGNIIIEKKSGDPYLIDFEQSEDLTGLGNNTIRTLTDFDIEQYNLHFGTNKPTFKTLKKRIKNKKYPFPNKWYAPSYFGAGLRIGALYNPEVGWGRWQYILKDNLPNSTGHRVLDLGANNGFNSLQILRGGANEAIAIEIEPAAIEQGIFLKSVFEWSDKRKYNFNYIKASMADLVNMDLGTFDQVIALCSIYYLDDNEITTLIRHISSITNCFIVQCNIAEDMGRENLHTYEKASVEYLKNALINNGFSLVNVIEPKGYSRPLIIAHSNKAHESVYTD